MTAHSQWELALPPMHVESAVRHRVLVVRQPASTLIHLYYWVQAFEFIPCGIC